MAPQVQDAEGPYWVDGDMTLRVVGTASQPDRQVTPRRPFALLGRLGDADVTIDDRAVSVRHVYLHLDHRGVYAVDLVTRTGMRINGVSRVVGWLRPGDAVEVGGRQIELVRVRYQGVTEVPPPCDDDLLADQGTNEAWNVTLEPRRSSDSPWALGSELVFLGWSASCGIQLRDRAVARTHCAVVRSPAGVFLVDLCGQQTWVNDRAVRGVSQVLDGDLIAIGSTQFIARVEPPAQGVSDRPTSLAVRPDSLPAFGPLLPDFADRHGFLPGLPVDPRTIPAEAQTALLAWMMGTINGGQVELARRQGEFQVAMSQALQHIQRENATLLHAHLEKIENIGRELVALRTEIERRSQSTPVRPPPPNVAPLRIARTTPSPEAGDPKATTWLLDRVNQLEDENKSAWKDLLGRLTPSRKPS